MRNRRVTLPIAVSRASDKTLAPDRNTANYTCKDNMPFSSNGLFGCTKSQKSGVLIPLEAKQYISTMRQSSNPPN